MSEVTVPTAGFGPVRQLAYIVADAEKAALEWVATFGAGPFWVFDVQMTDTWYRGTPGQPLRSRIALGQLGDMQIELICPVDHTPSVYTERPPAGMHHVCFWHDVDEANRRLVAAGHTLVQEGLTPGGDRFSYLDGPLGAPYIEFVDPGAASGNMARFFDVIAAASRDWDGQEPLRSR
jgi:hypothetical protein